MTTLRAALLAGLLALGSAAGAQDDGTDASIAEDFAGEWQIVPADGAPACAVRLGSGEVSGGWPAAARCEGSPAAATAAWSFADGLQLRDAGGAVLMAFEEDEGAVLSSPSVAAPAFYLVPAIPGFARLRQPGEWAGVWRIAGKASRSACVLRFGPPARVDGQHLGGSVTPVRCRSAALGRMDGWYLEGMDLMLTGPDDAQIAFSPDGAATHRSEDGRWQLAPGGTGR
ncbi:AprI/Inh family metalloprotease inhibitor [Erythrobacter colymbi]|uniref:AprI/Inh family metalloprotease inhibitor n=1 Tax=Erythrobacter colymbi TaxID=1161202 RepID=UPI00138FDE5A|nr:AprI/Inh family metalloprotease inhibitor [Erythrobacter colymbi]